MTHKLLCCLSGLSYFMIATSVSATTLEEALSASLKYESGLKVSSLMVNQSQAILDQAKQSNGLKINLVGQVDYEQVKTPRGVLFPTSGNRQGQSAQLQLDYPVYTSGRHQLSIELAKMQLAASHQGLYNQTSLTMLKTVMVYTDVLRNTSILALKNSALTNFKRSLYEAGRRFDAGIITRADLAQVQAQVAQGQADVTGAESNLDISRAQFYQVTGQEAVDLKAINHLPKIPNNLDEVMLNVKKHPALVQAQFEKQATEKQYALIKRELRPTVMLTSRIGTQHEASYIGSESDNYMVGVQLNMPLYDSGLNRANIKKSLVDVDLANQKIESLRLELNQQAQMNYAQLNAIRQNKQALQQAIDSASIALTYIHKELEFGTKTTYDLLTAEQKLLDIQTQKIVNDQDEVVLVYQLLDKMGSLDSLAQKLQ